MNFFQFSRSELGKTGYEPAASGNAVLPAGRDNEASAPAPLASTRRVHAGKFSDTNISHAIIARGSARTTKTSAHSRGVTLHNSDSLITAKADARLGFFHFTQDIPANSRNLIKT